MSMFDKAKPEAERLFVGLMMGVVGRGLVAQPEAAEELSGQAGFVCAF